MGGDDVAKKIAFTTVIYGPTDASEVAICAHLGRISRMIRSGINSATFVDGLETVAFEVSVSDAPEL